MDGNLQVVPILVERRTNDVTLKVVVAFKSSALESSRASPLPPAYATPSSTSV